MPATEPLRSEKVLEPRKFTVPPDCVKLPRVAPTVKLAEEARVRFPAERE